jgi:hypothetical protein
MKGSSNNKVWCPPWGSRLVKVWMIAAALPSLVYAAPTPPDMTVCDGVACNQLTNAVCSAAGFSIALKSYVPAKTQSSGAATYVYEICSPAAGTCQGTLRAGESCLDNSYCRKKGQETDPQAF